MAIHVEDHPIDYASFEGEIPAGEYGGGKVETWDRGTWEPLGDPDEGMRKGYEPVLVRSEARDEADQATEVPSPRSAALQSADGASPSAEGGVQQLWQYEAPRSAGKFLDEWCCQVMRSRIEPMKKIARTLRSHRPLILNYFPARKQFSSGVVERLNNKAKLTMRKSHGVRTFPVTEIALYHTLGKLPEPDVANRFF